MTYMYVYWILKKINKDKREKVVISVLRVLQKKIKYVLSIFISFRGSMSQISCYLFLISVLSEITFKNIFISMDI